MTTFVQIDHINDLFFNYPKPHSLMGVFAHPDDESLLMGGTFALAHVQQVRTSLIVVTRGELGGKFSGIYGKELSIIRSRELIRAARTLDIDTLTHLRFPDKGVHTATQEVKDTLVTHILENKPQVLVTHDRFDLTQHPDHLATAQAVIDAVTAIQSQMTCSLFFSTLKPDADRRTCAMDLSQYSEIKAQACNDHVSQRIASYQQTPLAIYYALHHFEYFMLYDKEKGSADKRYSSDKK